MHSHVGQENTECIFGVNFGHNYKSFVCGVTGMKVMFPPSVFFTYLLLSLLFSDQRRIKEVRLYLTKLRLNPERVERPKKEVQVNIIIMLLVGCRDVVQDKGCGIFKRSGVVQRT